MGLRLIKMNVRAVWVIEQAERERETEADAAAMGLLSDPLHCEKRNLCFEELVNLGRLEEALAIVETRKNNPDCLPLLKRLAAIARQRGEREQSLLHWRAVADREPTDPNAAGEVAVDLT